MSLWTIAWRSIQQRGLASVLTAFSMSLGVMLVVAVLTIYGVVDMSFKTNASLGYNMIVGAKGGRLQLTLNTVYYLSSPVENVPYDFYLEFLPKEKRDAAIKVSLREEAAQLRARLAETQAFAASASGPMGLGALPGLMSASLLQKASQKQMDLGRDGRYAQFTSMIIPVCLGDYYGNFRVVGTTPAMFEELRYGEEGDKKYEFSAGRNFKEHSEEHGYFEAVIGATAAREKEVKVGDTIAPAHGDPEGHTHARTFTVVGILKPTGTPNDRGVFVNMEGFYLMEDHAKPIDQDKPTHEDDTPEKQKERDLEARQAAAELAKMRDRELKTIQVPPLAMEQREVTAMLVKTVSPLVTPGLQNVINEGSVAQAVLPVQEIYELFETFVRPIQLLLLALTSMICVVSGLNILVSIYNSMSERKHEIAVMRALGASRRTIMTVILLESVILAMAGGMFGWIGGHTLNASISESIEERTGVSLGLFTFAPPVRVSEMLFLPSLPGDPAISPELLLIPALILLAVVVGFLPALAAYRTDVARSLG